MFFTINGRGYAKIFPKLLGKERMIVISCFIRNLNNRDICIQQEFGRIVHTLCRDIRYQRSPSVFLKE